MDFIVSELETFVSTRPSNLNVISRSTDSLKSLCMISSNPPNSSFVFKSVEKLFLSSDSKVLILHLENIFPEVQRIYVWDGSLEKFDVIPLIRSMIRSEKGKCEYFAYWKLNGFSESDAQFLRTCKIYEPYRIIVSKSPDGRTTWKSFTFDEDHEWWSSHVEKKTFYLK